jgi:hypothetical protein
VYWFTLLWLLLLLRLFYERDSRALSQVSGYVGAVVARSEIEDLVMEKLDALRCAGIGADAAAHPVASALLRSGRDRDTASTDVKGRVSRFLDVLAKSKLIERLRDDDGEVLWRQSLLCAVQVNELFSHGLIHIVPFDGLEDEVAAYTHSKSGEVHNVSDE